MEARKSKFRVASNACNDATECAYVHVYVWWRNVYLPPQEPSSLTTRIKRRSHVAVKRPAPAYRSSFRSHKSSTNINWLLIEAQISVNGMCIESFVLLNFAWLLATTVSTAIIANGIVIRSALSPSWNQFSSLSVPLILTSFCSLSSG